MTRSDRLLTAKADEMLVMLEIFRGCIETGIIPAVGSPCHGHVGRLVCQCSGTVRRRARNKSSGSGKNILTCHEKSAKSTQPAAIQPPQPQPTKP